MSARVDVLESTGRATIVLAGVKFASPEDFYKAVDAVAAFIRGRDAEKAEPAVVPATCRSCGRHLVGERCPTVAPPALGDDPEPAAPLGVLLERAATLLRDIEAGGWLHKTRGIGPRVDAWLADYARTAVPAVPTLDEKEGR